MKNKYFHLSLLMKILLVISSFLILSCQTIGPSVKLPDEGIKTPWQAFLIVPDRFQILVDRSSLSKANENNFLGRGRMEPTPERVKAIRDSVIRANRDAGLKPKNEEQVIQQWIARETFEGKCEFACKEGLFFINRTDHHILKFEIEKSGEAARVLFDDVCK